MPFCERPLAPLLSALDESGFAEDGHQLVVCAVHVADGDDPFHPVPAPVRRFAGDREQCQRADQQAANGSRPRSPLLRHRIVLPQSVAEC